jgi:hypothetical protein
MKKFAKPALSAFLTLCVTLTAVIAFSALAPVKTQAAATTLFTDSFDNNTQASGWNRTLTTQNNQAKFSYLPAAQRSAFLTGVAGSADWVNYVVSASVTITDEIDENIAETSNITAIVGQYDGANGYQFRMIVNRSNPEAITWTSRLVGPNGETIASNASVSLNFGVPFEMKMSFYNNVVACYINGGTHVIREILPTALNQKGTAGVLLANGFDSLIDNFTVTAYSAHSDVFFAEDFNVPETVTPLMARGFRSNGNSIANISEEKFVGVGSPYLDRAFVDTNGVAAADWTDYTVEAKLTYTANPASGTQYAGIVGRTASTNNGYEYTLNCSSTGNLSVRLYCRDDTATTPVSVTKAQLEALGVNMEARAEHRLRMTFVGQRVILWVDSVCVADIFDTRYTSGSVGFRAATGSISVFDDFIVRSIAPEDLPGKNGNAGNVWWQDDFSADLTAANYNAAQSVTNGKLSFTTQGFIYLNKPSGVSSWTDYVVEVDVCFNEFLTDNDQYAGIVARSTNTTSNGYEFRIYVTGAGTTRYSAYKRSGSTTNIGSGTYAFDAGAVCHMKMLVVGNRVICYVNGDNILDWTDPDESKYTAGYPGIRTSGNVLKVDYDNFLVRGITPADWVSLKIEEITEVTPAKYAKIAAARAAYDALNSGFKALVSNYGALLTAEQEYNLLLLDAIKNVLLKKGDLSDCEVINAVPKYASAVEGDITIIDLLNIRSQTDPGSSQVFF